MKKTLNQLWMKIKSQPDIWLFFGFLLTFPFSIRKVFWIFPIRGNFNEYTSMYLYASDIFLILILIYVIFYILCNINNTLSMYKQWISPFFHNLYISIPAFLVILSFFSIFWSQNKSIASYRSIKLFEVYFLYIYMIIRLIPLAMFHVEHSIGLSGSRIMSISHVPRGTIDKSLKKKEQESKCSTWNIFMTIIIAMGTFQSLVGIWQFIIQRSIGLNWLKESLISPNIPGVAKIILDNQRYIRAYGLFPHPNILGGFLLFSIIITLLYKEINCSTWNNLEKKSQMKSAIASNSLKLFHVEQSSRHFNKIMNVPRGKFHTILSLFSYNFFSQKLTIKNIWLIYGVLSIQSIALFLTFSKSAIIGTLIAIIYIRLFQVYNINHNCSTWNNYRAYLNIKRHILKIQKMFHVEHFKKIFLSGLIALLLIFFIKPSLDALFLQSLEERSLYLNVSRGTILANPIFGVGAGQLVLSIPDFIKKPLEIWQFQPVHNIYLQMWSELGIISLGLFLWLIWKLFHVEHLKRREPYANCSTWNNYLDLDTNDKIILTDKNVPRGTFKNEQGTINQKFNLKDDCILYNVYSFLSIKTTLVYFQGILLGLLFIGLFDHYLYDIWSGQILFWLVMGVIAGINTNILLDKR